MPNNIDFRGRQPVYTQSEVVEMQESFKNTLLIIHKKLYDVMLNKNDPKKLQSNLANTLEYVFDEAQTIKKDIKISE